MNALEQRFMETLPRLLYELIDEVKGLREDIKELNNNLKNNK